MKKHYVVFQTSILKTILKSLTKKRQLRRTNVIFTPKLRKVYLDDNENIYFKNTFLYKLPPQQIAMFTPTPPPATVPVVKKKRNLSSLAKNIVIENFTGGKGQKASS